MAALPVLGAIGSVAGGAAGVTSALRNQQQQQQVVQGRVPFHEIPRIDPRQFLQFSQPQPPTMKGSPNLSVPYVRLYGQNGGLLNTLQSFSSEGY